MTTEYAPGTPSWLRARNQRIGLTLLLEQGPLTRNQISSLSGLSRPTTNLIVSHLEEIGLVQAIGEISGGRGPYATNYAVRTQTVLAVAVDIDGRRVRSMVVDAVGTDYPVAHGMLSDTPEADASVIDVSAAIDRAAAAAGLDPASVRYVLVGVQGAVDTKTDEIKYVSNLEPWPTTGLRAHLESHLRLSVTIENDVNLAAVAERAEGVGAGQESFALLWLSDGLGLALDLNGVIHRGAAGGAGEIGLLPTPWNVHADAENLEELFGSRALAALAGVDGADPTERLEAALDGELRADILRTFARRVAVGIEPVLAIIDPGVLVIGGPVGTLGGEDLAEYVAEELHERTQWRQLVRASGIERDPVLRGAKHVLVEQVRQHLLDQVGA